MINLRGGIMVNVRTDLAIEAREIYNQNNASSSEIEGIKVEENEKEGIKVTTVRVIDEKGVKNIGKPIGSYTTIDIPDFTVYDSKTMTKVSERVYESLKEMVDIDCSKNILVVGLGNWHVTPDALGPKTADKIMVTRHLKRVMPEIMNDDIRPVSSVAPGVLGLTGIETVEIIKGIVQRSKPDLIICIDALAARKVQRVNRTIQIGDTGICPGAGVGNNRKAINEETLGVKVIAIGVPTVVDAVTIANDTIDLSIDSLINNVQKSSAFYKMIKDINKNEKADLIREVLNSHSLGDMIVTPKDVDLVIESLSKVLSDAINMAVQPNMNMEEINNFMF